MVQSGEIRLPLRVDQAALPRLIATRGGSAAGFARTTRAVRAAAVGGGLGLAFTVPRLAVARGIARRCARLFARCLPRTAVRLVFPSLFLLFFFSAVLKIGLVPARAFEAKGRRRDFLPQRRFATFRAVNKWRFRDFLQGFEMMTARVTHVFINWHIQRTPEPTLRSWAGETTRGIAFYYKPIRA